MTADLVVKRDDLAGFGLQPDDVRAAGLDTLPGFFRAQGEAVGHLRTRCRIIFWILFTSDFNGSRIASIASGGVEGIVGMPCPMSCAA